MTINSRDTVVEIFGANGDHVIIAGPDAGEDGFWLAPSGFEGLYDPPVKVVYEEPGNWPGSRFLSHRILRRDVVIGVFILEEEGESWAYRDSRWRKLWSYEKDTLIRVTHPESKPRTLKVRLGENIKIDLTTDPNLGEINLATMSLIAGDPFWYEDDAVFSATTQTDTTFDPNPLPWPWPQEALPTEDLTITVKNANPTDQKVFPKWTAPGSTLPPAEPYIPGIPWLGAPNSPATIWTIPDYSYDDPDQDPESQFLDRRLRMPSLIGGLRTNEVQSVAIVGDAHPTGGYWTLDFDGEVTSHLAWNITNTALKSALEALPNIALNDVDVQYGQGTNEEQEYVITGGPTGGTYKLSFDGQQTGNIAPWTGAAGVQYALGLLPNLNYFDIAVTAEDVTNEVQEIQFTGAPSGGYWTITFNGQTTSNLAWNCSALDVMNALSALSNVGIFQIYVTQDWWVPYSPFVCTFAGGNVAGINQNSFSVDGSHLTGGAGVGAQVTTRTEGGTKYKIRFGGAQTGINVPQLVGVPGGLTGGVSPGIAVTTDVQGKLPWVITFQNNLSGLDVPKLIADVSNLTGGSGVAAEVIVRQEGATAPAENALIDSDPRVEQVISESGSALWARMNGVRFRNYIPPWTKEVTYTVTVSGAVEGQMVTLRIPRPWSRPWGLE